MNVLRILAMTFTLALAATSVSATELNPPTNEFNVNNKSGRLTLPGTPKTPPIRPGKSLKGWSGFWTWNPTTQKWFWTWVWIASTTGVRVS